MIENPNDPSLRSFIDVDPASPFPIQNLPFGAFVRDDNPIPYIGVAIGDQLLDLQSLEHYRPAACNWGRLIPFSLDTLMASGPEGWRAIRRRVSELLRSETSTL